LPLQVDVIEESCDFAVDDMETNIMNESDSMESLSLDVEKAGHLMAYEVEQCNVGNAYAADLNSIGDENEMGNIDEIFKIQTDEPASVTFQGFLSLKLLILFFILGCYQ